MRQDQPNNMTESTTVEPAGAQREGTSMGDALEALRAQRAERAETAQPEPEAVEAEPTSQPTETDSGEEPEDLDEQDEFGPDDDGADEPTDDIDPYEWDDSAKFLIDGEEITGEELRQGRMREQDYRRKTQHVAETRKRAEATEQMGYAAIQIAQNRIGARLKRWENFDWSNIAGDESQFRRKRIEYENDQREAQEFQSELARLTQEIESQRQEYLQRAAKHATSVLSSTVKGWSDQKYRELVDFASDTYEMDKDVLLTVTDPGLFRMAADAAAYRKGRKVATRKLAKPASKSVKRGKPATADTQLENRIKGLKSRIAGNRTSRISEEEVELLRAMRKGGRL